MTERSADKRQYPRYPVAENLYCYIDGTRFDAPSRDISAGGLFLRTPKKVPFGASIALVFKDKKVPEAQPVFLIGRVVRHQAEPEPGIGLCWDRAVTHGSATQLELFLTLRMGIIAFHIGKETVGPRGEVRHVFDFAKKAEDQQPETHPRPHELGADGASSGASPGYERSPDSPPRKLRTVESIRVVKSDGGVKDLGAAPLPAHVERLSEGAPGPLSSILQRGESLASVDLDANVEVAGRTFRGTILGMSVKTMFLTGVEGMGSVSRPLKVAFSLPVRTGAATITCTCRVLYEDDGQANGLPGLELEIDHYDEGDSKGILWTYLKWVTFKQIQGQKGDSN